MYILRSVTNYLHLPICCGFFVSLHMEELGVHVWLCEK